MQEPSNKAELYRKVAGEYSELAKNSTSPFLRGYYQRVAEDYLARVESELRSAAGRGNPIAEESGLSAAERAGS